MKKLLILLIGGLVFGLTSPSWSQQSTFTVEYMITFSSQTQRYTVWVVPAYSTPNANNSNLNEFGATAQFSLRVPREFTLSNITDIRGVWEKNPSKLQTNLPIFTENGIVSDFDFYVIGKSPQETNYGPFVPNVAVALFSFQGNTANANISVLENTDPFVTQANANLALNVACSFYSRSGQAASGNATPLEQFKGGITFEALQNRISGNTGGTGNTGGSDGTGGTGGTGNTGGTGGTGGTGNTGGSDGTGGTGGTGNTGGTDGTGGTGIVLGTHSDLTPGQVYPNPVQDILSVSGLSGRTAAIQIVDMQGRTVYQKDEQDPQFIPVQSLLSGLYLIRIKIQDQHWTGKFLKIN